MQRKTLIAGNWKMFKTAEESITFVRSLKDGLRDYEDREILICPPYTSIYPLKAELENSPVILGAQNVYYSEEGAFTGEISPVMLKSSGVEYVISGHSERRNIFGESDEDVNKKLKITKSNGMVPVLCVGEKLEERENQKTFSVVKEQVEKCLEGFEINDGGIVIAYEPVWAIGTGLTATPEQAEEVHAYIRKLVADLFGRQSSESVRILYGGSVKPDNIDELMKMDNIDGALVGGASLDVKSFLRIIDYNTA